MFQTTKYYTKVYSHFSVIHCGFNISVLYVVSQFIVFLSFYSEYLFAEPSRYSQKPQMSYINCQGSRRKSGMTQSPLMRHWEMQIQQCYLQAFHVKMLT